MSVLHLVRTRLDVARLTAFAATQRVLDDDQGYALHLALRRRFGAAAPQPWRLMENGLLLGYATDRAALALPQAPPDPMGDWSGPAEIFPDAFESRAMPATWAHGLHLRFELRMRPVRRRGSRVRTARTAAGTSDPGTERDAFLTAVEEQEEGTHEHTRTTVYSNWLAERLDPAARLDAVDLTAFRRSRVFRSLPGKGGRGPAGRGVEGPDASMTGRLTVTDGTAFAALLAGGVGRHAAFGYGMLLLRPAG